MPISSWNFTADEAETRHIGPVAQDFYAAFGLGADDKHIAPLDANGVALAGVKELNTLVQEQETQIAELEARLAALETANAPSPQFAGLYIVIGALGMACLTGLVGVIVWQRQRVEA
jgi:hypothetical protein